MYRFAVRLFGTMAASALLMSAVAGSAAAQNVKWANIDGIVPAGTNSNVGATGTGNPAPNCVAGTCVNGAGTPWTTLGGQAKVNLANGQFQFNVKGLVLAGGNNIGTVPSTITTVIPTFVCITASGSGATMVTTAVTKTGDPVPLSSSGDGQTSSTVTLDGTCKTATNIAFLIRP
jgi:hypothetical protein